MRFELVIWSKYCCLIHGALLPNECRIAVWYFQKTTLCIFTALYFFILRANAHSFTTLLQMTLVCIYLTKILKRYNLMFKMSLIK